MGKRIVMTELSGYIVSFRGSNHTTQYLEFWFNVRHQVRNDSKHDGRRCAVGEAKFHSGSRIGGGGSNSFPSSHQVPVEGL